MTKRTAVIGAGLAGLSCARTMRRAGFLVEVFERDHSIGGRIATTRLGPEHFDHGAQYVTGQTTAFKAYLDEMVAQGHAARWHPRTTLNGQEGAGQMQPWIVGTPGMSSIVRPLAESVRVHTGRRVHTLDRRDNGWHVWFEDETSIGPFHAVAVAVPAVEACLLLGRIEEFVQLLSRVRMSPCWSLVVRLEDKLLPEQDIYAGMSEVVHWIARNNTKPGRASKGDSLVIHASPAWSIKTQEAAPEAVADDLWIEVSHLLALPPVRPTLMTAHLWRHGLVDRSLGETYVYSDEYQAGVAGDWCFGRLAEHAFESGDQLGRAIIRSLV